MQALADYAPVKTQQLTQEDLHELQENQIFIGNHSNSHPMFDKCTEEEIKNELEKSRNYFEDWKLKGYSVFAYPNGSYNFKTEKILEEENIRMAFIFDHKINRNHLNPLRISRLRTNSYMSVSELKVKVSGLHSFLFN